MPDALGSIVGRVSSWGAEREAYTDRSQAAGAAAYYRVATCSKAEGDSEPSDVVYAIPVLDRQWVDVRAGRGPWETASGTTSWRITLPRAVGPGADPSTFVARSRTWAGASTELEAHVP